MAPEHALCFITVVAVVVGVVVAVVVGGVAVLLSYFIIV